MNISDTDIKTIIESFVDIANKNHALDDLMAVYSAASNRTLGVRILGSAFHSGFIFKDGVVQTMESLDRPTLLVEMDKGTFWNIINSESAGAAKMRVYAGIFAEESVHVYPPPGVEGGLLHLENVIRIFGEIAKLVMG